MGNRRAQALKLMGDQQITGGVQDLETVQIGVSLGAVVVVAAGGIREHDPQRLISGEQGQRERQRLPFLPGPGLGYQRRSRLLLVEPVQGVQATPLVLVHALVAVVLEGSGHRVEDAVAHRAGGIVHGRVVGIRQRIRVRGARGGFFHVEAEEVVVRPTRPRAVAVGGRGRVALQEYRGVEDAGMRVVGAQRAAADDPFRLDFRIVFGLEIVATPVVADNA